MEYILALKTSRAPRIVTIAIIFLFYSCCLYAQSPQKHVSLKDSLDGFRYLLARKFKLRMGIDIAKGPEQWAYYIVFGSTWLK